MITSANTYDVIVIGGGMAGCAAAMSSAREGAHTLLIEREGFLGGWATAALVNPFMTHKASNGKPLIGGIFSRLRENMAAHGGMLANCFNPEILKFVWQEMVLESGAEMRLHTWFESTERVGVGFAVNTLSKSGRERFECGRIVDCSGDGDAAVSLGADYECGDSDGLPQAATLMFDVGGVDVEKALAYVKDNPEDMRFPKLTHDANPARLAAEIYAVAGYYKMVAQARQNGEYAAPGDIIFYISRPHPGEVSFNTTHIGMVNGANAADLTRAEIEGKRQMISIIEFARKYVPGFENCFLLRCAPHVGIRETRRITGRYKFSEDDIIAARKFDDAILRLAYPVDIHHGKGSGYTREEEKSEPTAPPPGDWYEVPYRCLLPVDTDGLLVAGRCVSSTQAGHGAIRIMPACSAMGEAAGTAAAISLRLGVSLTDIPLDFLLDSLRRHGALV